MQWYSCARYKAPGPLVFFTVTSLEQNSIFRPCLISHFSPYIILSIHSHPLITFIIYIPSPPVCLPCPQYLNIYVLYRHTVKSTVRRMNTPVLIPFSTWVHTICSCLWTVLLFLTWLYTRFWLYMMQKHPYFEKHSLSLQTQPVIRFATIDDRISLTYESRMTILSSTLNRIVSKRFISEKISAELDI